MKLRVWLAPAGWGGRSTVQEPLAAAGSEVQLPTPRSVTRTLAPALALPHKRGRSGARARTMCEPMKSWSVNAPARLAAAGASEMEHSVSALMNISLAWTAN